jgi:hypothetical protein
MALRFRFALPGLMPRSSRIGLTITKGFNEPLTLSVTVDAHYATCVEGRREEDRTPIAFGAFGDATRRAYMFRSRSTASRLCQVAV